MELQSMAIDLPPIAAHPNRAPFCGVLTLLDTPSDRAPSGARGHRVVLTHSAAEQALPSLLGMGLDYAPSLDRHDTRHKVGIITEANIVSGQCSVISGQPKPKTGNWPPTTDHSRIEIAGYLYARDFPEVMRELRRQTIAGEGARATQKLGMSYEITDARIDDLRAAIWTVSECTFTGAAVLRRDKAAYRDTWIELIG
ncbi:MAG: hypothetical protein LAN64_02370 [Acidobacteriia bacterium]|nr:hypothetical protein [Terriglobia bacterium]